MDTINIRVQTDKVLNVEDIPRLKATKNINSIGILKDKSCRLIISIPRTHYLSNAYLVTSEWEVQSALEYVKAELERLGYKIMRMEVTRVEYPFTYIRPVEESFNSHRQVFQLFSMCGDIYGYKAKDFGKGNRRENYLLRNSWIPGRSRSGISIYDQHLKINETERKLRTEKILKDYPDLPSRTRVEISMRYRKILKDRSSLRLNEVKKLSYKVIDEVIFKNIYEAIKLTTKTLTSALKKARVKQGNSFKLATFIRDHKELIFDYTLLREAIKKAYINYEGAKYAYKAAKKELIKLEESEGVFYIGNLKRIENIKKQLKKESRSSTRGSSKAVKG